MPETRGADLETTGVAFGAMSSRDTPVLKRLNKLVSRLSGSLQGESRQSGRVDQTEASGIELEART